MLECLLIATSGQVIYQFVTAKQQHMGAIHSKNRTMHEQLPDCDNVAKTQPSLVLGQFKNSWTKKQKQNCIEI